MTAPVSAAALAAGRVLDPAVLARIQDLSLVARVVVDGFLAGLHRSPRLGVSTDFAEHRAYQPGDDIRRVDWRLYARTDRVHIREYEAETNAEVVFVLDTSASMGFGSAGYSKLDYARVLVACLAQFSARQRDRVGLALFADGLHTVVPPSLKHLPLVHHALARATARGGDASARSLRAPLREAGSLSRRRRIWVVVSDFYAEPDEAAEAVGALRANGGEVVAFHLLDRAELQLPYAGATTFVDAESGEEVAIDAPGVREAYAAAVAAHVAAVRAGLAGRGVDAAAVVADEPLDGVLFRYLAERERLRRVR